MNSSTPPPNNVIRTDRFGLTKTSESEPAEPTLPPMIAELAKHLEHVSAEINTACRAGFYVAMGVPTLEFEVVHEGADLFVQCRDCGSHNVEVAVNAIQSEVEFTKVRLNYQVQPLDPSRVKYVDHRDEMAKQRNPDYQPPGAG